MGFLDDVTGAFQSTVRIVDTARVFAKNGIDLLRKDVSINNKSAAVALRKSFEELGATYIKLGQLIASAPGLFPRPYVEEMQACLDQVNPIPYDTVEKILKQEFGNELNQIFDEIDRDPLASASIAQVHSARLVGGEDVVIKVQRPGIETKLNADLNLLYVSAYIFEKIAPGGARASLTGIVQDFHQTIFEEVDFLKEAKNIEEFDEFLQNIGQDQVVVPRVYHKASTKKVLTMQRFYGVPLTDLKAINKLVKDPEKTLVLALNTWFQSLLFCGFFHADVHAGNLMVLNDGRVGFIDFGIVGRMEKKIWNALMDLMQGLSEENYKQIAQAMVDMNATEGSVDVDKFADQLRKVFKNFSSVGMQAQRTGEIDEAEINELLIDLVQVSEENGLKIPREFALLFKQMLYFDRYIRILAPELNIMQSDQIQIKRDPKKKLFGRK